MTKPNQMGVTIEGDIVITSTAYHYRIDRVTADANAKTYLQSHRDRITALAHACELAGEHHRVFLAESTNRSAVLIDCTDLARRAKASMA